MGGGGVDIGKKRTGCKGANVGKRGLREPTIGKCIARDNTRKRDQCNT